MHRREFTHSKEVVVVSSEAAIKAEEGRQSLKRAKYVQHCGLGKIKTWSESPTPVSNPLCSGSKVV